MQRYSYKRMIEEAEASLILSDREPRIASLLLEDLFGIDRVYLMLHEEEEVPGERHGIFEKAVARAAAGEPYQYVTGFRDRKSTRLNSSHVAISYAVFCLKKNKTKTQM